MAAITTAAASTRTQRFRASHRLAQALTWGALVALTLWAATPIVYLLVRGAVHHESLSGGDGLFAGDQLQYLAWIRSSGEHGLAGNGFALRTGGNVFLHPMFVVSGLLWRAGVNIALSYLLWLPVAVGVLYLGFRQFSVRMLQTPMAQAAALILALFFVTPVDPLVGWTVGSSGLGILGGELAPSAAVFGYLPIAIATGLLALFMLGLGQITDPERSRSQGWYVGATSAAGLLVAWLHPWQGASVLVVIIAMLVLGRFRRPHLALLIPALVTALPLGYYLLLSKIDAAWKVAGVQVPGERPNVLLLVLALAPLVALAAPELRHLRRNDPRDLVLWLWPGAALLVYLLAPEFGPHALEGVALPLSVLAVRGWQRRGWRSWLAVTAIVVSTAPGLVYILQGFHRAAVADPQALLLRRDETDALDYLARAPMPGGVLASLRIATAVPPYTGRRTWVGHPSWTPGYPARARAVSVLFDGRLAGAAGRRFLRQAEVRYLVSDCEPRFRPSWLGPLVVAEHRFGCVAVYQLKLSGPASTF